MSRKITCTPPFISSCCCASDLRLLHTNTHMYKSNWDPSAFPCSSFIFFCERCLTGCINANTEVGLREGATKRARLEKRGTKRSEWIGGRKRSCVHREQDREKQKERWREQVFSLSSCHFTGPLYERPNIGKKKKEDMHHRTTHFAPMHLTHSLLLLSMYFSFLCFQVHRCKDKSLHPTQCYWKKMYNNVYIKKTLIAKIGK